MSSFKTLSKRQIQRKTKKKFELLRNQCRQQYTTNDCNILNTLPQLQSINIIDENLASAHTLQMRNTQSEHCNDSDYLLTSHIQESGSLFNFDHDSIHFSSSEEDVDNETFLKDQLREWACSENVPVNSVNKLLKILHPHFDFLPSDYRKLLGTPRVINTIINLNNGKMFYLGILRHLLHKLRDGFKISTTKIHLQVNIDGLPLFKSSSVELYPILGMCPQLVDDTPFAIACFSGNGKPDPLDAFLKDFMDEVKVLRANGFIFEEKHFDFDIDFFICDAPARAYLKGIMGHTSKHGCEKCTITGQYKNHRINFADGNNNYCYSQISDNDFLMGNKSFIKTKSPLLEIGIKLVTQFPLDSMHLIYLGVVKRLLLNYYIEGRPPHKLSQQMIRSLNSKISIIKLYQPSDFARKCRTFNELKRWKATEYRSFLLYYGVVVLQDALKKEQYEHFLLLHCSVYILSNDKLISKYLQSAETFLNRFVSSAPNILNEDFVVYNVHSLSHLVNDVRKYGSINKFSCFPFENYLGSLKRKLHSKKHTLQQVHHRLVEYEQSVLKNKNINSDMAPSDDILKVQNKYNETYSASGDTLSYSCKKIYLKNYILSNALPDNCILLRSKKICLIQNISISEGIPTFEGLICSYCFDLYINPMPSSKLNIYFCKGFTAKHAVPFSASEIMCKGFLVPHKDGFAFFALNHKTF